MEFGNWFMAIMILVIAVPWFWWSWKIRRHKRLFSLWNGTGKKVQPEEITNIPAYNRAISNMWAVFVTIFGASGIVSLFSITAGAALATLVSVLGIFPLFVIYEKIYKKYKRE